MLLLAVQWQSIPFPVRKSIHVSPVLLFPLINLPVLSSCYKGHLTLLYGVKCPSRADASRAPTSHSQATVYCARVSAGILPWRIK